MASTRSRSAVLWFSGVLVIAAAAVVATRLWRRGEVPAPAPQAAEAASAPAVAPDAPLPETRESDARVRDALAGVTPRDVFQRWLGQEGLLDRLVVTTVNLAEDTSPARPLSFLRPRRPFAVTRRGPEAVIADRSAARYDVFADVISSLDEHRVAAAYRTLHPLLETAYHALGYPGQPFDALATRALQRIVDAPVRDEVAVVRSGSVWVFADPQLEALGPVEKQLLRMGARNTRRIQGEAREIADALGFHLRGAMQAASPR